MAAKRQGGSRRLRLAGKAGKRRGGSIRIAPAQDVGWSLGRRPTIAFSLIFAVLLVNGVLDYWYTVHLHADEEMLAREYEFRMERLRLQAHVRPAQKEEADRLAAGRRAALVSYRIAMITGGAQCLLGLAILGLACYLTGREFAIRSRFEECLLSVAENVQRDIARDIHDDVGQELTGLGLKAETLAEMLAPGETPQGKLAADISAALDRTRGKVRALSRGLSPLQLEEGMLADALEQLVAATNAGARIACKLACLHAPSTFGSRLSSHLYRIAQEAVANAVRHSGARNICIALDEQNGETVLRIEDDGCGLSKDTMAGEGMGLRTMRYRAELIGAKLEVGPGPSGGTQVVCRLAPLGGQTET
jgi:signal transduction histidine kinase